MYLPMRALFAHDIENALQDLCVYETASAQTPKYGLTSPGSSSVPSAKRVSTSKCTGTSACDSAAKNEQDEQYCIPHSREPVAKK